MHARSSCPALAAFTYSPELHDVVEVTRAGYDACSSANNISAFRTGNDAVPLTAVGTRYFLCGLTGHCGNGMKIRVDVVAADDLVALQRRSRRRLATTASAARRRQLLASPRVA